MGESSARPWPESHGQDTGRWPARQCGRNGCGQTYVSWVTSMCGLECESRRGSAGVAAIRWPG
ncbi:hypothetical protein DB30_02271 [Enhygromyxa salina]|uniref:Uncharacterized protein n=1 Tax=Enhygromyxa salina TaxID=215803 RepID=A0A0C2CL25_9BACT|nr:hypothetical protein DB30_02271 [Enhygromyxa salina]